LKETTQKGRIRLTMNNDNIFGYRFFGFFIPFLTIEETGIFVHKKFISWQQINKVKTYEFNQHTRYGYQEYARMLIFPVSSSKIVVKGYILKKTDSLSYWLSNIGMKTSAYEYIKGMIQNHSKCEVESTDKRPFIDYLPVIIITLSLVLPILFAMWYSGLFGNH
jgi:hypothetical protein